MSKVKSFKGFGEEPLIGNLTKEDIKLKEKFKKEVDFFSNHAKKKLDDDLYQMSLYYFDLLIDVKGNVNIAVLILLEKDKKLLSDSISLIKKIMLYRPFFQKMFGDKK